MHRVDRETFDRLVEEAWVQIPRRFRRRVHNLSVEVEDCPPPDIAEDYGRDLLGLYQGVPLTQRSTMWASGPDRIVLYKRNIEAVCRNDEELREEIRDTLWHELGHYFGMNEEQLYDSGY